MTLARVSNLALALAALTAAAPASASAAGGLSVHPARIDAQVQRGSLLPPVTLRNGTGRALQVQAQIMAAGQGLDGLPIRDGDVDAARLLGRASPGRFTIAPGGARKVRVRVTGARPLRGKGSYGVLVFTAAEPPRAGAAAMVAARVRLGANLLLSYGRGGRADLVAQALRAEQAPGRRIRFQVRVGNQGSLHGRPRVRLTVRDADGRAVLRARPVGAGAVLPGAVREFPVLTRRVLPAGDYVASATVRSRGRTTVKTLRFRLVGDGVLPSPSLQIAGLPVPKPGEGEAVEVLARVRNAGTAPAALAGEATVGPQGGAPEERAAIRGRAVAPGETRVLRLRLPPVGDGAHELAVELRDGDRVVARRTLVFSERASAGLWDRFRDWAAGHVELLLGAFGGLVLALLVMAAVVVRRLQRRLRVAA